MFAHEYAPVRRRGLSRRVAATAAIAALGAALVLPFIAPGQSSADPAYLGSAGIDEQGVTAADQGGISAEQEAFVVASPTPTPTPTPEPEPVAAASSSGGYSIPYAPPADPGTAQGIARDMLISMGYGDDQWACLHSLWMRESNWNVYAENPSSGAYGIPQSLPGSKMETVGSDWRTNPVTQITWGLGYIQGRYGSPCGAWGHSQAVGWY